ncbi:MAG TPA: hypothetical protein VMQ86_11155 [Bryobacteraceae bacterium]|jgi:hypothetical protein|nr:hypothetical protein [Bryobacteraceae bacterium]
MVIAMALAPDKALPDKKEDTKFTPLAASSYASRQTSEKITIGVLPYFNDEDTRPVFGKNNPYKYGVLPVLVVIQNDSPKTIRVQSLQAAWIGPNRDRAEATPAKDVRYLTAPRRPNATPGVPALIGHKNPLDTWEIEGRAFAAQVLPPGQSASGFFYFQTGYQKGSSLYLSGMSEAESGQELLYFEIPIVDK